MLYEVITHTTQQVQELAVKAHRALFLKGYSRTDILLKDGELHVLETNRNNFV